MKSFYEMMRILEGQMPQDQMPNSQQGPNFPPEIEQERQLRLRLKGGLKEAERVWGIIGDALVKHGVPDERDVDEWYMLYGMDIEATIFTHKNGPYSGIERVAGVVYPDEWKKDDEGWSPRGYQIDGNSFDGNSIAAIHDIGRHQWFRDVKRDFYYER